MSHFMDGLIGTTTHKNPHLQQSPMYGTHQYLSVYVGPPYYPPPPYQQPYPVALPPPIIGPPPTPMTCPAVQPSSGNTSTFAYTLTTSESATPSYVPYRSLPQHNPYFPLPGPPQTIASSQGKLHVGVNFVHPSLVQKVHNFKQLNT
jgi:hypothetical protein